MLQEHCMDDDKSLWRMAKFDPQPPSNSLTNHHQNLHRSLHLMDVFLISTLEALRLIDWFWYLPPSKIFPVCSSGVSFLYMCYFAHPKLIQLFYSFFRCFSNHPHGFWHRKCGSLPGYFFGSLNHIIKFRLPFPPKTTILGPQIWTSNFSTKKTPNGKSLPCKRPVIIVVAP